MERIRILYMWQYVFYMIFIMNMIISLQILIFNCHEYKNSINLIIVQYLRKSKMLLDMNDDDS